MNETSLTTPPVTSSTTTSTKDGDGGAVGRSRRVAVVVEHWIQPSDTFQGICLLYGVTSTQLRRANYGFSGTNLSLAPNPLRIPNPLKVPVTSTLSTTTKSMTSISDTDTENNTDNDTSNNNFNSNEDPTPAPTPPSLKDDPYLSSLTVSYFLRRSTEENPKQHPPLAETEARCYLELNEWNVSAALTQYRKDLQRKVEEADDPHGEVARFDTPLEFVVMDEECS